MLKADICISACGQSLYELAAIGVPTVAIVVADNQLVNAKGWSRAGFIKYAGWHDNKSLARQIIECIDELKVFTKRLVACKKGRGLCDAKGARRVAEYICKIS